MLVSAFEAAAGLPPQSLRPVHTHVQLWGAAIPLNTVGPECVPRAPREVAEMWGLLSELIAYPAKPHIGNGGAAGRGH